MTLFQIGICKECGCTDNNACVTEIGPCFWVNEEHDLCSCCSSKENCEKYKISFASKGAVMKLAENGSEKYRKALDKLAVTTNIQMKERDNIGGTIVDVDSDNQSITAKDVLDSRGELKPFPTLSYELGYTLEHYNQVEEFLSLCKDYGISMNDLFDLN